MAQNNIYVLRSSRSKFPCGPHYLLLSLWRHRDLLWGLIVRDVSGRYRGSFFGIIWSFIQPLIMLAIYTLVFGVILQARWANTSNSLEFALALFAGLIVFNFFAECLNRAPLLVVSNPSFVKKVVFPLEVFPWVSVGSALFHMTISVMVWMLFYLSVRGLWHVELLYLPIVLLPLIFLVLGLSWLLSSIGVYIRDISQLTGLITTGLLFLSPVFYDISMIPSNFAWLYRLNPLTFVIQQARHVMLEGIIPDMMELTIYIAVSLLVAWSGLVCFQRTRHGFADVI